MKEDCDGCRIPRTWGSGVICSAAIEKQYECPCINCLVKIVCSKFCNLRLRGLFSDKLRRERV